MAYHVVEREAHLVEIEGFVEEAMRSHPLESLVVVESSVAAHEAADHVWIKQAELAQRFWAVKTWHAHIEQDEINAAALMLVHGQGSSAAAGGPDGEATRGKVNLKKAEDHGIVVDHEDAGGIFRDSGRHPILTA